jgi:hypothetical protein
MPGVILDAGHDLVDPESRAWNQVKGMFTIVCCIASKVGRKKAALIPVE